jgi:geranylgeranyl diphosphate synthase type I
MIPAVEDELKAVLKAKKKQDEPFHGMLHYHMGWVNEELAPTSDKSGKRIRPLLCLLATLAAGGNWEQAVPGAASVELLHNFTLIHDDIQDTSPTRRGRPTLWKIWGENQAINSGDAMFAMAHIAMTRMIPRGIKAELVVQALQRLDETCINLTIGQFADMNFEKNVVVTVQEYMAMIYNKTAALIEFSAELGAFVAGCEPSVVKHWSAFGRDLGLAFQIRDDILGIWGDESVLGKSAATDIATRKKSLPIIFGLSKSRELVDLYFSPTRENFLPRVVRILDSIDARSFSEEYEKRYANSSLNHLEAALSDNDLAIALRQLATSLLDRTF